MAGFGERLRRERELRGIKLEEIAEATKIGVRYLRALEDEDLPRLPGGIFSRGFVRAYAKYLGIDEEQAIADFVAIAGEAEAHLPDPPTPPEKPVIEARYSRWWLVAALLALIAVLVYLGRKPLRREAENLRAKNGVASAAAVPAQARNLAVETPAKPAGGDAGATPKDTGATVPGAGATPGGAATKPDATATSASGVVVELHTTQEAWVQWSVDDGPMQDAVFPANVQKRIAGNAQVKVKVGNAGAIELTYNGKTLSPLGKDKQVKTLTFTAEGMRE